VDWERAWHEALYGPSGFYRSDAGPAGHFSTATHGSTGAVLAQALVTMVRERGLTGVVDVGAGRGELLTHLYAVEPGLRLTGVDVVSRPDDLPHGISWLDSPGGALLPDALSGLCDVLVVAHEWLDVVPCPVVRVDERGVPRRLQVDPRTGREQDGDPLDGPALAWAVEHWPTTEPHDRLEVGLSRDRAWSGLLERIDSGVALAVDYGHTRGGRPAGGTLTAYARGRETAPVPDGSCDLTAHVAMDSLDHDELLDQRTALQRLGVRASTPDHSSARTDPVGYLRGLEQASAAGALLDPRGFGGFLWAVKDVG
jgi:SAM-dependent MidA family methyltransferase